MRGGQLAGILRLIPIRGCGLLTMLQVPGVPFPLTLIPSPLPKGRGRMLTTLRIDSGLMSNQTRHVIPLRTVKNLIRGSLLHLFGLATGHPHAPVWIQKIARGGNTPWHAHGFLLSCA